MCAASRGQRSKSQSASHSETRYQERVAGARTSRTNYPDLTQGLYRAAYEAVPVPIYSPEKTAFQILLDSLVDQQNAGLMRRDDPVLMAGFVWAVVHGISMLVIDGQLREAGQRDALEQYAVEKSGRPPAHEGTAARRSALNLAEVPPKLVPKAARSEYLPALFDWAVRRGIPQWVRQAGKAIDYQGLDNEQQHRNFDDDQFAWAPNDSE